MILMKSSLDGLLILTRVKGKNTFLSWGLELDSRGCAPVARWTQALDPAREGLVEGSLSSSMGFFHLR